MQENQKTTAKEKPKINQKEFFAKQREMLDNRLKKDMANRSSIIEKKGQKEETHKKVKENLRQLSLKNFEATKE